MGDDFGHDHLSHSLRLWLQPVSPLTYLTHGGWTTLHTRGGTSQLDCCFCCWQCLKSCKCLTNIYSISAYGLDFIFCSQLEGQHGSVNHRRTLGWLGQNVVWDPLRRKRYHGSAAVPSTGAIAAVATLSQLCWSVKVSSLLRIIRKVPASPHASVTHLSICLR